LRYLAGPVILYKLKMLLDRY